MRPSTSASASPIVTAASPRRCSPAVSRTGSSSGCSRSRSCSAVRSASPTRTASRTRPGITAPGAALVTAVGEAAQSSQSARWWLLAIGGWLLLWTGYMGAKTLVRVHATVWDVPASARRQCAARVADLHRRDAVAFLVAMSGARWLREETDVLGLDRHVGHRARPVRVLARRVAWLPHRGDGWRDLVPGAVLVAVGVQALHLFTAYLLGPKLTNATRAVRRSRDRDHDPLLALHRGQAGARGCDPERRPGRAPDPGRPPS